MSVYIEFFKTIISFIYPTYVKSNKEDFSERFYAGCLNDAQKDVKKIEIKGIVTFIDEKGSGRIDGYITFDSSSNISYKCQEKNIKVGSDVLIDIVRNSKISPWCATKIVVLNSPSVDSYDDFDGELCNRATANKSVDQNCDLPEKQVGMITYAYHDDITLNNDIFFKQKDCGPNSFRPIKGDWVVVQYDHSVTNYKVVGIAPLRYMDFEGSVSSFNGTTGYVNKEIFFNKFVTKNERWSRGMFVLGTAIESVQGKRCNFRALTIFRQNKINRSTELKMRLGRMEGTEMGIENPDSVGLAINRMKLDFGEQSINESKIMKFTVKNKNEFPVVLTCLRLSSETNNQFVILGSTANYQLGGGESLNIQVKCCPQFPGFDRQTLYIEGSNIVIENWKILLEVSVYVFDPVMKDISNRMSVGDCKTPFPNSVSGIHFSIDAPIQIKSILSKIYPHKLKMYPIPLDLEARVDNKEDIIGHYPILEQPLTPRNYVNKMDLLVHLEEINTKQEMKQFVLENVRLIARRDTFGIEVPGLSEGRPSLMVGDKVDIIVNVLNSASYSGSIEDILCDCIFVKFHATLHSMYTNEECTVTFKHSRLPFRRMHLGIEVASGTLGDGIIFPEKIVIKSSQCVRLSRTGENELSAQNFMKIESSNVLQLKFYNSSLNELQKVAVLRILHGYSRPLPYILFGPPGTGKTVTLVESVLQVYKNVPSSRILLCAPSNSAADLLCLRLDESGVVKPGEMVRMNAYRRTVLSETSDKEPIPPCVKPYCKSIDEVSDVAMHRIIIATCISSGALYRLGLKSGHISHVFVDEAGQASEPEIMVSLALTSSTNGQIILAGDPMQLGPVIRSSYAQPLQDSYLHRLMLSCKLYQPQKEICPGSSNFFDPLIVTQLLNNYRSHPALLKFPSELFYGGTLIPSVEKTRFINWQWLPNPKVPFIFHGVRGKEFRNKNNPSTYNPSEAVMVVRWIGRLLQDTDGMEKLDHANISVITPYRAQVDCIRKLIKSCLEDVNLAKLKVASVEEFQGQENEVIIISTVRSSLEDNVGGSGAHESLAIVNTVSSRLGFLANKRRFNVAITRACSLLIVIGDPALLQYDECWNGLVQYATTNGAYLGAEL